MGGNKIDRIIGDIDGGLEAAGPIFVGGDHLRALQDEVWAVLGEGIDGGWLTEKEAYERYLAWQQQYRPIGHVAVEPELQQ